MRKQIIALRDKLQAMIDRAEILADSDNDNTAAKYEAVADSLLAAMEALEEVVDLVNE
jgi:hypothetical protein